MKLPNLRDLLSACGRISSDHHYSWTRASLKNEEAILCSEGDKRLQGIGFLFVEHTRGPTTQPEDRYSCDKKIAMR